MVLQKKFSPQEPALLGTFPATSIATGTGILPLYCGEMSGAYLMSDQVFSSTFITTSKIVGGNPDFTLFIEIDYDLTFTRPLIIEGNTIINITGGMASMEAATAITVAHYMVLTISKISGGDTTVLGTETTSTEGLAAISQQSGVRAVNITVARTSFKEGDVIRLNVALWGRYTAGTDTPIMGWGHDPTDRNDDGRIVGRTEIRDIIKDDDSTQLIIYLPIQVID